MKREKIDGMLEKHSVDIDYISNYMSKKYRHLEEDTTKDIIKSFCRYCKSELYKQNKIIIGRFGTFYTKDKNGKMVKTIFNKKRMKPKMKVPFFRVTSEFRRYLNR